MRFKADVGMNFAMLADAMADYPAEVARMMKHFFDSLSEKDRRRYAAVEAIKLGHGGIEYVAHILRCDPKTIRQGLDDLQQLPDDPAGDRIRKKGKDSND